MDCRLHGAHRGDGVGGGGKTCYLKIFLPTSKQFSSSLCVVEGGMQCTNITRPGGAVVDLSERQQHPQVDSSSTMKEKKHCDATCIQTRVGNGDRL